MPHHWLQHKYSFFLNIVTSYHSKGLSLLIILYLKTNNLKFNRKNYFETNIFSKSLELETKFGNTKSVFQYRKSLKNLQKLSDKPF